MPESEPKLTLEQELDLRSFEIQVNQMSHEQAQQFAVYLYERMMIQHNQAKELLKHQWGIEHGNQQG